jgi:uncharacterized protein YndB with AHSA1/START domain
MDEDKTPERTAFRVETVFDADPSEVWRALTEPASMGEWLGRPVEFTLEPGADGTIGRCDDGDETVLLVVEEVDHERRLVFRWASAADAPTVVELDLRPVGRRTYLRVVERPLRPGRAGATTAHACALAA